MLRYERKEEGRRSVAFEYWTTLIGEIGRDRDRIAQTSPINLVDQIDIPILIIHGEYDTTIPIKQAEKMERRLRKAGKPVRLVRLADSSHDVRPPDQMGRAYREVLRFLAEHLPSSRNRGATAADK